MYAMHRECVQDLPPIPTCSTCSSPLFHTKAPSPISPVSQLLNNNECPSSMEARSTLDILAEEKSRLALVEAEFTRIENAHMRLRIEREILKNSITKHEAILSPCRLVPAELLSEIFSFCLPLVVTPAVDTAPLLLTLVCRKWRAIALATPQLWSSICIRPSLGLTPINVEGWLRRAGNLPLSLSIMRHAHRQLSEEHSKSFMDLVISHAHRWCLLHLHDIHRIKADVCGEKKVAFPILTELQLNVPTFLGENVKPITIFHNSPSLHTLCYSGSAVDEHLDIPWSQLTSVLLTFCDGLEHFFRIARRSPNMTRLKVIFSNDHNSWPWANVLDPVEHLQLHELFLQEFIQLTADACTNIFKQRSVKFPSLKSFKFVNSYLDSGNITDFPWSRLFRFCSYSGFSLTHLSLIRFTISPDEWRLCFQTFPSLVFLESREQIHRRFDPSQGFNLFVLPHAYNDWMLWTNIDVLTHLNRRAHPTGPHLLPRLRTIVLHDVTLGIHNSACLAEMIVSRMEPLAIANNTVSEAATVTVGEAQEGAAYLESVSIYSAHWLIALENSVRSGGETDSDRQIGSASEPDYGPIVEPLRRLKNDGFDINIFLGEKDSDVTARVL